MTETIARRSAMVLLRSLPGKAGGIPEVPGSTTEAIPGGDAAMLI